LVLASGRLLEALMTRIVRTAYRYKRPPRRKQPVALEVPAVVKAAEPAKASKRAKSDSVSDAETAAAPANDDPRNNTGRSPSVTDRPAIVTIRSRKHAMLRPPAELVGADPASGRCMVPLLPWHAMVDGAARAAGLALRDLPSAAGRGGALGRQRTDRHRVGRSRDGGRGTTDRPAVSDPSRRWVTLIRM
jgi:hypothetical protein